MAVKFTAHPLMTFE